jgi:hypothetical protein
MIITKGKTTYKSIKGDYIYLEDGVFYFYAGDGRCLFKNKWQEYAYIILTREQVRKINFDKLKKIILPNKNPIFLL